MAEQKLKIKVGEHIVMSEIAHDPARSLYIVTSTCSCGAHVQSTSMSVLPNAAYTSEQLEYDLEELRHRMAELASGKHHIATIMPQAIKPVGDEIPEVPHGCRLSRPKPALSTDK